MPSIKPGTGHFEVVLYTYRTAGGVGFYANTVGPTVPVGVDAVLDLQNLVQMHTAQHPPAHVGAGAGSSASPGQDMCVGTTICAGHLTIRDLWSAYGTPATNTGSGQRVAIIGEGSLTQPVADLRQFEKEYALARVPVRTVLVDDLQDDTSNEFEWALDGEAATGMAPGVDQIDYYFGESLTGGSTAAAFAAYANDPSRPTPRSGLPARAKSLSSVGLPRKLPFSCRLPPKDAPSSRPAVIPVAPVEHARLSTVTVCSTPSSPRWSGRRRAPGSWR